MHVFPSAYDTHQDRQIHHNSQQLGHNKAILDHLLLKAQTVDGAEKEDSSKIHLLQDDVFELQKKIAELETKLEDMQKKLDKIDLTVNNVKVYDPKEMDPSNTPINRFEMIGKKFTHLKL